MISQEIWATDNDVPTPKIVPQPVGYRILIRPRGVVEKTKGGMTKAKHGAVHKPRRPSGKQMFKWDRESRFKNGGIFK